MKKSLFIALVLSALLVISALPAMAAPPDDNPGKGPPEFERLVFVHYGTNFAKPAGGGSKAPALYSYSGYHWPTSTISYGIDVAGSPIAVADGIAGITQSFQTWQNDPGSNIVFNYVGGTTTAPGLNAVQPDYQNVVGWADLSTIYPDAIGVTIVWATRGAKVIVDADTALNTSTEFAWTQVSSIDPDNELLTDTSAYDVDVQNIMTHEAGHWLQLNDLYNLPASEQTMYGYAADRELKKRSLESGDEAGVKKIYR